MRAAGDADADADALAVEGKSPEQQRRHEEPGASGAMSARATAPPSPVRGACGSRDSSKSPRRVKPASADSSPMGRAGNKVARATVAGVSERGTGARAQVQEAKPDSEPHSASTLDADADSSGGGIGRGRSCGDADRGKRLAERMGAAGLRGFPDSLVQLMLRLQTLSEGGVAERGGKAPSTAQPDVGRGDGAVVLPATGGEGKERAASHSPAGAPGTPVASPKVQQSRAVRTVLAASPPRTDAGASPAMSPSRRLMNSLLSRYEAARVAWDLERDVLTSQVSRAIFVYPIRGSGSNSVYGMFA